MESSLLVDNKTDTLVCLPGFSGENYRLAGGPAFLIGVWIYFNERGRCFDWWHKRG